MSFVKDWLRLNVVYDATVGLHYKTSATTLEILVPYSVRTRATEPLQKRSGSNFGFGVLNKAPTVLFQLVVHSPKTRTFTSTFVKNKCNFCSKQMQLFQNFNATKTSLPNND